MKLKKENNFYIKYKHCYVHSVTNTNYYFLKIIDDKVYFFTKNSGYLPRFSRLKEIFTDEFIDKLIKDFNLKIDYENDTYTGFILKQCNHPYFNGNNFKISIKNKINSLINR